MIPFNKPYYTGNETEYINQAIRLGKTSADGSFTKKCQAFFESRDGFKKVLLTTSCTDALEMSALLIDLNPGDEVILPSYAFASTANAFALRGARLIFADSNPQNPNIDANQIEELISPKTKAIVVLHYAGIACEMDAINNIAQKHGLFVVEDAAQGLDSYYNQKPLGTLGDLAAFSFHETKNVISGEGGMLVVNNEKLVERAEIIQDKGTNRSRFLKGEIDKYSWVDIGSSFAPSEIIAAFLYAQLMSLDEIQSKRRKLWEQYYTGLSHLEKLGLLQLPHLPDYATNNAHIFYLLCNSEGQRGELIRFLKQRDISAAFHYVSLHDSPYYTRYHDSRQLIHTNRYAQTLLRLPLYYELTMEQADYVIHAVQDFFKT